MPEITAAQVKALRERTGLPMMDCKNALAEAAGDPEKAIEILRKRGADMADRKAGRETSEGRIACHVDENRRVGAILEIRCESAPVANNPEFKALAQSLAEAATLADHTPSLEDLLAAPCPGRPGRTCRDLLHEVVNKIRENMQVIRVDRLEGGQLGCYVHFNGKLGVLVKLDGDSAPGDLVADLCMHICAMKPLALSREEVNPALVEKEREIARAQASSSGKPAHLVDKIAEGKMNRWYGEHVLLEQEFANPEKFKGTIAKYLAARGNARIAAYRRFEVGG